MCKSMKVWEGEKRRPGLLLRFETLAIRAWRLLRDALFYESGVTGVSTIASIARFVVWLTEDVGDVDRTLLPEYVTVG
jgi:hypothetical protein